MLPPSALFRLHCAFPLFLEAFIQLSCFFPLVFVISPFKQEINLSSLDRYIGVLGCFFVLHQAGSTSGQPCCEGNQALLSALLAQRDTFTPAGMCLELRGWPDTAAQNLLEYCIYDIAWTRGERAAGSVQKPAKA